MPDKTLWGKINSNELTFHSYGFNIGYNLLSTSLELPLSIGLGYIKNKFGFGKIGITTPSNPEPLTTTDSYDEFHALSLGIGVDYYVKLNLGVSLKSFESKIGGRLVNGNIEEYSSEGNMWDYGILMTLPISDLAYNSAYPLMIDEQIKLRPILNFSAGYSQNNIGDEIYFVDEAQKDPLTRTARLGYTIELGVKMKIEKTEINLINYSFSAEAEDVLIKAIDQENFTGHEYQSGIGDIKFTENLIHLEADEKVRLHRGHILRLFDTFTLTVGRISGRNYETSQKTDGIGFTTAGLFNLVGSLSNSKALKYIATHFTIEYFDANYEVFPPNSFLGIGTVNFDSVSLHFKGFEI
jgi:hypothetical protein